MKYNHFEDELKPLRENKALPLLKADKGYAREPLWISILNYNVLLYIACRKNRKIAEDARSSQDWHSIKWVVERCHAWLQRKFRRYSVQWEQLPLMWRGCY
ncbi:MAG: hypothetical protein K0S74_773 [Chlamydiales bacterium]|nr:hypothetical protein [Chlamydiales bacterium]